MSAWRGRETFAEEAEDPVERGPRRLSRGVDQIRGDHRVGGALEAVRVPGTRVDLDAFEGRPQLATQGLEACAGAERVVKRSPSAGHPACVRRLPTAGSA